MSTARHIPVLVDRVVALFAPALVRPGSVLVDATLGLGGHAEALLRRCPEAHVVGLDRDAEALSMARTRLQDFAERVTVVHAVFDRLGEVLSGLGYGPVDGVLFDLGVSSLQIDVRIRGFAYAEDAPLDMRMDSATGQTAADILNSYSAKDLARILRAYGEERFARRIADSIVRERARAPFETSARLVELIRDSIPAPARRSGGHPAKRTFQALRIEVNDELAVLRRALPAAIDRLAVGGRMVILSYHSLEDRLAKQAIRARARPNVPEDLPVVPADREPELRALVRGAERASVQEIAANPRAASVRLRAAERIREVA
ncbi:MAG: 16S rRNA (cytosine(1402)-N(4))-methyltransferase RsmH [Nocardioidaceae bacterium]